MKFFKLTAATLAAALMLTACQSKEDQLFEQIQDFPTQQLVDEYLTTYPQGKYADEVKNTYAIIADEMQKLEQRHDFQAVLDFGNKVSNEKMKAWAKEVAEPMLLDSLSKHPDEALCDVYVKTFPGSDKMDLIAEIRKKAQAMSTPWDSWIIQAYGPVKKVVETYNGSKKTYTFNQDGRITSWEGQSVRSERNSNGYVTEIRHTGAEYWEEWSISFMTDANGRIVGKESYWECGGSQKVRYTLDERGFIVYTVNEEMECYDSPTVTTEASSTYTSLDDRGNWTTRKVVARGKTYTYTRTIEYWE